MLTGEVVVDPWKQDHHEANFSLARELGHWRLHRHRLELGEQLEPVHRKQALVYAETFLLPRSQLQQEWGFKELLWCGRRNIVPPLTLIRTAVEALSEKFQTPRWSAAKRLCSALRSSEAAVALEPEGISSDS
jgi:hypothetical protein